MSEVTPQMIEAYNRFMQKMAEKREAEKKQAAK